MDHWSPNFLASETTFVEDSFSMNPRWAEVGDDFGMILIRNLQPISLASTVHSRVHAALRI